VLLIFLLWISLAQVFGQLGEIWRVAQPTNEIGYLCGDITGDGYPELVKDDGYATAFYDGTAGWNRVWIASSADTSSGWNYGLMGTMPPTSTSLPRFLFAAQDYSGQQTVLECREAFDSLAVWQTAIPQGNVFHYSASDADGDSITGICVAWNHLDNDSWYSGWKLIDATNGTITAESDTLYGFLSGPWNGDLDGDGRTEILFNLSGNDSLSFLICVGESVPGIAELWRVPQGMADIGFLTRDITGDGFPELVKENGYSTVFFSGSDQWTPVWVVVNPDTLTYSTSRMLATIPDHTNSTSPIIFVAQNTIAQHSALSCWTPLDNQYIWTTRRLQGVVSGVAFGDVDGDGDPELSLVLNWWNPDAEQWNSEVHLQELQNGEPIWNSETLEGYVRGPWMEDMNGDGWDEILYSVYSDSTSTLVATGKLQIVTGLQIATNGDTVSLA